LHAYINCLQDDWVHWLPLAEFAYNNSVHAFIGLLPFYAAKGIQHSIKAAMQVFPAYGSVPDVPNIRACAKQLMELWAAVKQRWKEATTT
jgi:hypothetical protein